MEGLTQVNTRHVLNGIKYEYNDLSKKLKDKKPIMSPRIVDSESNSSSSDDDDDDDEPVYTRRRCVSAILA